MFLFQYILLKKGRCSFGKNDFRRSSLWTFENAKKLLSTDKLIAGSDCNFEKNPIISTCGCLCDWGIWGAINHSEPPQFYPKSVVLCVALNKVY
jgi:hypothetical protein